MALSAPGGSGPDSLIIQYCDECGVRLTERDQAEGRAVILDDGRILCVKCATKLGIKPKGRAGGSGPRLPATVPVRPVSSIRPRSQLRQSPGGSGSRLRRAEALPSSQVRRVQSKLRRSPPPGSQLRRGAGSKVRGGPTEHADLPPLGNRKFVWWALIVGGTVLIGAMAAMFLMTSGS